MEVKFMECLKCRCTTCEKIETCCRYHRMCAVGHGQTLDYVEECDDYEYSEAMDKYMNGTNTGQ